jgi:putative cell wall-binding protein
LNIRTLRGSKRLIAAAAAVAVAASTFAFSAPTSAVGVPLDTMKPSSNRFSGNDRFSTAAAIAQKVAVEGGFECEVVVVNGNSFADGLSAASLTAYNGGVILLSQANTLPGITVSTIESLADANCTGGLVDIYIVGGRAVISETVADALRAHPNVSSVTRYAGANRYTTSLAVAEGLRGDFCSSNFGPFNKSVIVATGRDFPDALAAGPLAYNLCAPIVLHDGDAPSSEMKIFLEGYEPTSAFIIGGTAAVPASIEAALVSVGLGVTRLAGANRFETAVAIAEFLKARECGVVCDEDSDPDYADGVILANGRNFPDALAAAPLSYVGGRYPILLTETNSIPAATAAWHLANSDTLKRVWVVGGTAAVSGTVLNGAVGAATAVRPVVTSATTSNTVTQAKINLDDVVTLTATTALPGATGNEWTVTLTQQDPPTVPNIAVNTTTKTITVTHNYASLSSAAFRAFWNSSGAVAYFTAVAGEVDDFTTDSDGSYDSRTAGGVAGGTTVSVTLTYSRPIYLTIDGVGGTTPPLFGPLGITGEIGALGHGTIVLYTGSGVTDVDLVDFDDMLITHQKASTVVTAQYTTEITELIPVAGTTTVRLAEGAAELDATPYNDAKREVTSPRQQLVLTAAS